jgi:hypothetical protein
VVLCPDVAPYINSRFDCCDLLRSGIHYGARAGLKNLNRGDKWSFCLTAGKIDPRIRKTMSRRARRNHTPAFKAKVALAARADVAKALVWRRWTASINDDRGAF